MSKFFEAKAAMPAPVKDTKAYNYQYATLSQVKEIVDKACADHGIGYMQFQVDGNLHTVVIDSETNETIVTDVRKLSYGNDQARGSSETYQRRYALLTVFGLAPEDDDGAAASAPKTQKIDYKVQSAKERLWAACKTYGAKHDMTPEQVIEGVKKRPEYAETADFFTMVAQELESE